MGYDYYNYYGYDVSPYARGSIDSHTAAGLGAVFGAFLGVYLIFVFAIAIIQIVAMWKLYTKAGEKGWKAIIPIYNVVILFKISGLSPWLILAYLTMFIPFIGWIVAIVLNAYLAYSLAKSFGKDGGYAVGIFFLAPIFYMILAFGKSEYVGPSGKTASNPIEVETSTQDSEE